MFKKQLKRFCTFITFPIFSEQQKNTILMKTNYLYLGALLVCFSACKKEEKTETVTTEVKKDTIAAETPAPVKMDSAAMMKAWAEYSTPGANHKMLADENGKWDEAMIMKMDQDA